MVDTLFITPPKAARKKGRNPRGVYEKVPGSGVWWVRHCDADGRLRRERVGTKAAAIKLYNKRRSQADAGVKLPESLKHRGATFAELADLAKEHIKDTYARPSDDLQRLELIKERLSGRADAITPGQIKNLLTALTKEKKWSASSRNHHHNIISLAFRLGIEQSKVTFNPARAVKRESEKPSRRVRFLTAEEEKQLRTAIRSKPEWAEHEPELDLAMSTGLRRKSMYIDLIWENVDEKGRTLTIPSTKNDDPITVPLNQVALRALAIFKGRGEGTGRVVRNAGGQTLNVNAHWFVEAVRAAKITNFHWHDVRHTYASRLRQTGTPLGNIAELLGHRQLEMTRRYAHLSISNLHEAVARIVPLEKPTGTTTDTRLSEEFAYIQ